MNLPERFETLEDAVSAFIQGCEEESEAQFAQSDVCALACIEENRRRWGMTDEAIISHIGKQAGRSRSTMYARLLVGRVFPRAWREAPENSWCKSKSWSHFEACARTWSEADPEAPLHWLSYCVENDLSVRQLRMEIRAARGDIAKAGPTYLLDAAFCILEHYDGRRLVLRIEDDCPAPDAVGLQPGDAVVATVVLCEEETPVVEVAATRSVDRPL